MNILISLSDLRTLAARAAAVVPDKPAAPVLASAILEASGAGVHVTAGASAITYRSTVACNVVAPGRTAIPADDLLKAAKNMPDGVVSISIPKDGRVLLTSGRFKSTLPTHDPADYPMPPEVTDATATLTLPAKDLARIIDDVSKSMATDDTYGLGAVLVEYDGKMVRLVATDGAGRLAWSETEATGTAPARNTNIPRKGVTELRKLLDGGGDVTLAFGPRAVVATVPGATLHMQMGIVDFPGYREVIPKTFTRSVLFEREALITAMRRVSATNPGVHMDLRSDGSVTLTARAVDKGESADEVDCDLTGEPLLLGYMAPLLLDALSSMGGDRAMLRVHKDALSPCILTDPDYPTALWVVMPARLS